MFLTYNGVSLSVEHVTGYTVRRVYDPSGCDYLYDHHRLAVRAIWNPRATADGTKVAGESFANLRATLMTPRKLLLFEIPNSGGTKKTVISSPFKDPAGDRYPCDCNNGPKPIGFNVVGVVGEKTMIIDFEIETWVRECTRSKPIISHRWEMSHSIDRDFLTTRTINGIAIFRTDWLNGVLSPLVVSPDQFRGWLFHPVPYGFQRQGIQCSLSPDNTTLRYQITDVQQYAYITPPYRGIVRVDVSTMIAQGQYDWAKAFQGSPIAAIPKTRNQVTIRVWGRPGCSPQIRHAAIGKMCASAGFGQKGQKILGFPVASVFFHGMYLFHSATSPYSEAVYDVNVGPIQELLLGGGVFNGQMAAQDVFVVFDKNAPPVPTTNPGSEPPAKMAGTRELKQALVSQFFSEPCDLPNEVDRGATPEDQAGFGVVGPGDLT